MPPLSQKTDPQSDSNNLLQLDLRLRDRASHVAVDLAAVARQQTLNAAIVLCVQSSGLDRKQVYTALDIDPATWSRIESGQAYFPVNKLDQLMDLCANEAPLMWLVNARRYDWASLRKKQSDTEMKLAKVEQENTDLRRMLKLRAEIEA
jgi:helix-turn-helix protein